MTKTDELIQMIVDIALQDYESFQMIEKELSEWALEKSLLLSRVELEDALAAAVQHGLIQAFKYHVVGQEFEAVPWNISESEGLYYLTTKQGHATLGK